MNGRITLRRCTLLVAAVLFALPVVPGRADTVATPVTIDLKPTELILEPGATRPVTVVITNTADKPVTFTDDLRWKTEPFVSAKLISTKVTSLAAGGSVGVTYDVTFSESAGRDTTLVLVAAFEVDGVPGAASSTLVVKPAPASAAAALTTKLSTTVADLNQYRSTDLIVTLTNAGTTRRRVTKAALTVPGFVDVSYGGGTPTKEDGRSIIKLDRVLAPGEQAVVVSTIKVTRPLQPGKATLLAEVTSRPESGTTESTTTASADLTFLVLGESAFLDVVGIPSLLLVPGMVFAVVLWLLLKRVHPKPTAALGAPAGLTDKALFWILVVPVSIALCMAYRPLTALVFREARDIRTAYGFDDILFVWVFGGIAALIVWFLVWILPLLARHIGRALVVPEPGDEARTVLRKLSRRDRLLLGKRNETLKRNRAYWTPNGGQPQSVVVLRQNGSHSLVSSPILYGPVNPAISDAITADDASRVAGAIKQAGPSVHIRYRDLKPDLVDNATLVFTPPQPLSSIVQQDV